VRRRHLSPFDLGLLANTLKPKFEKAAAERKAETTVKAGKGAALQRGETVTASVRQPLNQDLTAPLGRAPTSAESAAKVVGVSARTVENVASIQKHAPALIPDIKAGALDGACLCRSLGHRDGVGLQLGN
jgi:hypothetical protein